MMPDPNNPYGDDPSAWDPSRRDQPPAPQNPTAPWQTGQPVDPQDQTMVAPAGWTPSAPVPPSGPQPPVPPNWTPPPAYGQSGPPPPYPPSGPSAYAPSGPPPYYPGSQPPPPGWGPGGPAPRRGIPTWAAVSGIVVALLVVVGLAVTAVTMLGNDSDDTKAGPTSATPPPTISVADLQGLLPSIGKVGSLLQISGLAVDDTWSDTYVLRPDDRISDSACTGVQYVSEGSVYSGSGFTAMRGERLKKKGNIVDVTVSTFPGSDDAAAFVARSTQTWRNCARKPLSRYFASSDESESWLIGAPEVSDNTVRILNYEEGGEGWACSHAMGNATNVVVETLVCGIGVEDEAGTLMDDMLSAIAG